jgi:hypothetical protein
MVKVERLKSQIIKKVLWGKLNQRPKTGQTKSAKVTFVSKYVSIESYLKYIIKLYNYSFDIFCQEGVN